MKKLEDEKLSCRVQNPITREEVKLTFTLIEELVPQDYSAEQLLNILFRAALPHIGLVQIGRRGFFFPGQSQQLGIGRYGLVDAVLHLIVRVFSYCTEWGQFLVIIGIDNNSEDFMSVL